MLTLIYIQIKSKLTCLENCYNMRIHTYFEESVYLQGLTTDLQDEDWYLHRHNMTYGTSGRC